MLDRRHDFDPSGGFLSRAQVPDDAPEEIKAYFRLRFEENRSRVQVAELLNLTSQKLAEIEREILRRYMVKKTWGAQ